MVIFGYFCGKIGGGMLKFPALVLFKQLCKMW